MMMTTADTDDGRFAILVEALRPWLPYVVVAGGWAHRLHRQHPLAQSVDYPPLATLDADVAIPEDPHLVTADIRGALQAGGFSEVFTGNDHPPVTHYQLGSMVGGFYAEFLAPLKGGEYRRDGTPDATVDIGGVTAQKLRHVDLLLLAPWSIRILSDTGTPDQPPLLVRVPNATSYVVQKLLIHDRRKPEDQAKDILYIHDTIELFSSSLDALGQLWRNDVAPVLSPKLARKVRSTSDRLFSNVTDIIRESARIAAGRGLSAQSLLDTCAAGLSEVLRTVQRKV